MIDSLLLAALQRRFGSDITVSSLPGETELNVHVTTASGDRYIAKVDANAPQDGLQMQDDALAHVSSADPMLTVPKLVGREDIRTDDGSRVVRVLTWIDGSPLSSVGLTDARTDALGHAVACVDAALRGFDHPALRRPYRWNMMQAADLAAPSNPWAASVLVHFCSDVLPRLQLLEFQAIHNDANDNNVIVGEDESIAVIDYGDLVTSPRIVGLGVAIAYAMLDQVDPLAIGARLVAAYHERAPLEPDEIELLDGIVRTRLAMSITIAEIQVAEDPDNAEYLTISQPAVLELVDRLASIPSELARATYRNACGYLPVIAQRDVENYFGSADFDPASIVEADLANAQVVDWSTLRDRTTSVKTEGTRIGRYREIRAIYDTPAFETASGERRTLHLGIDIFVPAGSPACSPLPGVIHSRGIRDDAGDYGGVVLIEYRTPTGTPFWMLVGHLEHAGVNELRPGDAVARGAEFARVGSREENGGWEPHLHVQVFTDLLGRSTDLDGVARASEHDVWTSISPDPSPLLVGVDRRTATAPRSRTSTELAARRRRNLSPSLSLSYREPLHIVGGDGASLVDVHGGRWIDLVNNVAHVGHEHPRVVAAITDQVRRLNTNSRYLHENIVTYAERLSALFPDPLSVVFVTNSGSEACDLALRLARTATGQDGVLALDWAYHGNLSSLIEISPYKFNRQGGQGPSERVGICALPDPYRGPHGRHGATYADDVGRQARNLVAAGHPPAAFIHESIPGCAGQVELAPGYLEAAYHHARSAGAVVIADEVQTGLGRVGADWWAFETHGVVPDIVTMGKPLGNGHPLGAVITSPRIARAFANGMEYFNTFGGNPVSCAAGLAVLDVIEDERLRAHAASAGDHLVRRLCDLQLRHDLIGDVRGRGLFIGIDLVTDRSTKEPATLIASEIVEAVRQDGILISSDGPLANVLKVKPPLVITVAEIDAFVNALDTALANASAS